MKKTFAAFCTLFAIVMTSCIGDGTAQGNATGEDTLAVAPIEEVTPTDGEQQVTGVAIDGAMNSILLKVGDDTLSFAYPELDMQHRASWSIDDTVTVKYYETAQGDSVTLVTLGSTT